MAARNPVVVVAGQLRELPVGDSVVRAEAAGSVYDTDFRRIVNPPGGRYTTSTATVTGAITIALPVGMTSTMVRISVKVYEYLTNNAFEVHLGGYNYSAGGWLNTFAYSISNPGVSRPFSVRFGKTAAGGAVIYIGELASAWAYPQVFVTEAQLGYSAVGAGWVDDWAVTFTTAAFENVTATITNAQIGYAAVAATANALVMRDASGNITANALNATAIQAAVPIQFLNSGAAQAIKVGGLVVSNSYADNAPANGVYSKGVIQSGVATGTAPLTITSTTRVANLNVAAAGVADEAPWSGITGKPTVIAAGTDAAAARLAIGAGTGSGSVTSVGGTGSVSGLTLSGTVNGSGNLTLGGTLSVLPSNFASQTASYALVAPAAANGVPTFRYLELSDIMDAWTKKSVRAATTANITLSAPQTVDGIALVAGDRVLVKNQTAASQNGIYVVAAGAWARAADANASTRIAGGTVNVDSGTQGGMLHTTSFKVTDTLGTTAMNWFRSVDTGMASTVVGATPGAAAIGTSLNYARQDHVHPVQTSVSGNAGTATALATPRAFSLNGVSKNFDGTGGVAFTGAELTNPDPVITSLNGGQLAGLRNRLINGNQSINQRGFNGTWSSIADGAYGYDRWKRSGTSNKAQIVEAGNFKVSTTHVLSGVGVTTQVLTSPASGDWTITVPQAANFLMLEEGNTPSDFYEHRPNALELVLCQRYFEVVRGHLVGNGYTPGAYSATRVYYKVTKRVPASVTIGAVLSNNNVSSAGANNSTNDGLTLYGQATAAGILMEFTIDYLVNAEL